MPKVKIIAKMSLDPESTHFDHIYECKCGAQAVQSLQLISQYRKYSRSMTCPICKRSVYGKRREYINPKLF